MGGWFSNVPGSPMVGNLKTKELRAIKPNIYAEAVKSDSFYNNRTCEGAHINIHIKISMIAN